MEERMVQRVDRPRLDVRVSLGTTRLSPQCLIKAYQPVDEFEPG